MEKKRLVKSFLEKSFSKKSKAVFLIYLVIFLVFMIKFPEEVSAQSNSQSTQSQNTGNVCCVDPLQECFPNLPANTCANIPNSQSFNDATCNSVQGCGLGCCILGGTFRYNSEIECKNLANSIYGENNYDISEVFRQTNREFECYDLSLQEEKGCCVDDGLCTYGNKRLCTGDFNLNKRCSEINTCRQSCTSRAYKDCYEGSAYWFDSCGNPDELIEQCNYDQGTLCFKDDKETTEKNDDTVSCRSLDCPNTKQYAEWNYTGGLKKLAESWCIYDGPTGNFMDRPGSRHYRVSCQNGEEVIEPCLDFRKEVCINAKIPNSEQYASCFRNDVYDSKLTGNVSTVPAGFEFWKNKEEYIDQCRVGSTKCIVLYAKKSIWRGTYTCVNNCHCKSPGFIDEAAAYCKQFGDCSFNYNILDKEGSGGLSVHGVGIGISESYKYNLKKYGVFGGIALIGDEIAKLIETNRQGYRDYGKKLGWFYSGGGSVGGGDSLFNNKDSGNTILIIVEYVISIILVAWGIVQILVSLLALPFIKIYKKHTVEIKCNVWQPPLGGNDCGKCDDDPYKECSEYRCRSLGTSCKLIDIGTENEECINWEPKPNGDKCNECNLLGENCTEDRCKILGTTCELLNKDTPNPTCVDGFLQDNLPPRITPMNFANTGYTITANDLGYTINEKVKPLEKFTFGIKTHEFATCSFDLAPSVKYDDMQNTFGESYFRQDHNMTVVLQGDKEFRYYIKCTDRHGFKNSRDYLIKFTTDKQPDRTPPVISRTNIKDDSLIPNQPNNFSLEFEINEPGYCAYDTRDKVYDEMTYSAACDDEFSATASSYSCIAGLIDLKEGPNKFYFKCRDLENNTYRRDSYEFNIIRSEPLKVEVEDESPSGLTYTKDITLSVSTSKGSENGKAECRFNLGNLPFEQMTIFSQTNSNRHLQPQINLRRGNYDYYIKCKDEIGNIGEERIRFRVLLDRPGGEILNIYKDSSSLYVILDAASDCEYDNKAFVFGNGKKMAGEKTTVHTAPLEFNEYYIECKDDEGKNIEGIRINA